MSVPQQINDFITSKRPDALCNKCVAEGVGLTNDTAYPAQVTAALGTTSDFIRKPGTCSICKNDKTVIRRA
jgi:hypothetical protein